MYMTLVSSLWHSLHDPLSVLLIWGFTFQLGNFPLFAFDIPCNRTALDLPDLIFKLKYSRCIWLIFLYLYVSSFKGSLMLNFCIVFYVIDVNWASVNFPVEGSHIIFHQLTGVLF